MSKSRISFLCGSCGSVQPKWLGKCPECGGWNTLERFVEARLPEAVIDGVTDGAGNSPFETPRPLPLDEVSTAATPRIPTGIAEFDRVLGGGLVPGSAILLGGEPGIGKSTLLLQALLSITQQGRLALYATSEESAQQVKLRSERIVGDSAAKGASLLLHADSVLNRILEHAVHLAPAVLAVDSIQLVARHDLDASPGSATQLRRCCLDLVSFAKRSGCAVIIVGHVTKEGVLSGPKMLEHMVDVVLSFEGDRHHLHRVVRATKNRFGSTQEVGLFEMTGTGLVEVDDSTLAQNLLSEPRAGSALVVTLAGTRAMLAEVQALTATGFLGSAKRKASGVDSSRAAMLIAVLEKHGGLRLADQDIFIASAGGMRLSEPAVDLGLALAIAGAHLRRALPAHAACIGEISLAGDIRPVRQIEARINAAQRRGVRTLLLPEAQLDQSQRSGTKAQKGLELIGVGRVSDAINKLLPSATKS